MKTKALLLSLLIGLTAISFSSCDDEEGDVEATGISFAADTVVIAMEAAQELEVIFEPDGSTADLTWTSSDPSVATVANGIVTGIGVGSTTIAASTGILNATIVVTVTPKEVDVDDYPVLAGSNYYPISVDESTYEVIADRVVNDLRVDDTNTFLYIWDNTFTAGTSSGLNYFGQAESWISLVVGSAGWSGAGFNVAESYGNVDMTDFAANPDDYYFHVAMKGDGDASYLFILTDGVAEVKVNIGSSTFSDNGVDYPAYTDFARDNEWHSIEIPVSYLIEQGLNFESTFTDKNVLAFLAGGTAGVKMEMDAIFYYKKAE